MNSHAQRRQNDFLALRWVHRFGWLRATELGTLMWPQNASRQVTGSRLAKSLIERQLVLERRLPEGAGRALVLATAGVRLLAEHGVLASSGKDIGRELAGYWTPSQTWRHDLVAHGVLTALYQRGFEVFPEHQLRREAGRMAKVPDGLARKGAEVLWLEVENARKTGPQMRALAEALCVVAASEASPLLGMRPNAPLVAYVADATDERGHALSHRARVSKAVREAAKRPVSLSWAACELRGVAGVGSMTIEMETLMPERALTVLTKLNAFGWLTRDDGVSWAGYGQLRAEVWNDEDHGWSCIVVDGRTSEQITPAMQADSISAAKLKAAARIAELSAGRDNAVTAR
jgi:hypothetical protein